MSEIPEDPAVVLEQFVHDVANLPAEVSHLMEEIQAKDKTIQDCRSIISSRDASIQKFIKLNGSLTPNPKEEQYSKSVLLNLDRSSQLQDDKIQLSDKACVLLDRQIKKLDIKIRHLQTKGIISNDPPIPSLFNNKDQYRDPPKIFFPDASNETPSYSTPLTASSGNANALAPPQRLNLSFNRANSVSALSQNTARSSAPATPASAAAHFSQRQRESSAGAIENKRRRLNASLGTLPAASSNLRQSSLGPGTPKAGTPTTSRAGSAGPRSAGIQKKALTKKVAPHQQLKKLKALNAKHNKRSSSTGRIKTHKKSPSGGDDDDNDSMLSSAELSDSDNADFLLDDDDDDEGNEDTKVYCTCQTVSHGDMVACDNDDCKFEWFHWKCVGLTREPVGKWYCPDCLAAKEAEAS